MEGDRNAYAEEAKIKLAKQRRIINALKKEHGILLADYKVTSCQSNKQKDEAAAKEIAALLEEYEKYVEKLKTEQADYKEIKLEMQKVLKSIKQVIVG